ncbi:two-component regulator propeller domain-containing protein [Tenacibaculum aiptasiae]|uniref:sensor histidine kinase n=1 Tax=Tenacibaculum aiptasiae TaxID=426481 RepID=UPI00232E963D|nr:two-component regulator propeller domain-containing protein [Tenacibaculum aiptasiae]
MKTFNTYYNTILLCLGMMSVLNTIAQNAVYKHFTTEEGLSHDITYQIIQDSEGFIWIGTDDGLVKYNGSEFVVFGSDKGLKSNFVIDVIEDAEKEEYLIATWGRGIHVLKNDSIFKKQSRVTDYSKISKIFKLNDTLVYGVTNNSKQIFYNLSTREVIPHFLGFDKEHLLLKFKNEFKKTILDINQEFIEGKLYVFDSELNTAKDSPLKGVYSLNDLVYEKEYFEGIGDKKIHSLTKNNNNYILSSYNILFFYEGKRLISKKALNLEKGKIIQLQTYKDKIFFVFINAENGTRELYRYNYLNDSITNISRKYLLKSSVSDFTFDNDANLWITTYGNGVYQVLNTNNIFYDKHFFSNPDLRDVAVYKEGLITMAPNIVYNVRNSAITSIKIPFHTEVFQVKESNLINVIAPNKTNGSYKEKIGVFQLKNENCKHFNFNIKGKEVEVSGLSFKIVDDETIKKGEFHTVEGAYLKNAIVYKDNVYVVFGALGVYKLNVPSGKLEKWSENLGIESNIFMDIEKDGEFLWLATSNGVYKVSNNKVVKRFTIKDGLLSNYVNDLFIDKHKVLWAATQKGLNVLKKEIFYSLDKNLGQESSSVKKIAEYDSSLYVVGNKGLFKYDNSQPFRPISHTSLKIKQENTSFEITSINFTNANTVKVQYQLNKDSWIETSDNKIDFKNLTEDNYQIVFRYKDGLSDWNYSKIYDFEIIYPWYKQLWFYVSLIFFIASSIVLLVYKQLIESRRKNKIIQRTLLEREKLQKELKNVRHQIAQDFHDDLGNKLASISMLSNLSLKKTTKESNIYPNLSQINKDANFLYAGMRDFVWSLDYKNNKLSEVQIYLNDFGEKLFEYSDINFKSANNVAKSGVYLPHYWNKQLVLVFKEAMTNVLKHSKATEVLFSVYLNKGVLKITLEDNGVGCDLETLGRKNGLRNMKERMKSIKAVLNMDTLNGFKVSFEKKIRE